MAKNLNQILVAVAGLSAADAQLPSGVLLPINRTALAIPILQLQARMRENAVMGDYAAAIEAKYMEPAQASITQFRLDSRTDKLPQRMRALIDESATHAPEETPARDAMVEIMTDFNNLSMRLPGRDVVYLLRYLWCLSWDKDLASTVEAMDAYLEPLPELIRGRYLPGAAL